MISYTGKTTSLYWIRTHVHDDSCFSVHTLLGLSELVVVSRWRHQMKTFSALLALCEGNLPVNGEFPSQRPVTRSFDDFFDMRGLNTGWANKRDAVDLRRHRNHYDVMIFYPASWARGWPGSEWRRSQRHNWQRRFAARVLRHRRLRWKCMGGTVKRTTAWVTEDVYINMNYKQTIMALRGKRPASGWGHELVITSTKNSGM